jgi:hypothetical protein
MEALVSQRALSWRCSTRLDKRSQPAHRINIPSWSAMQHQNGGWSIETCDADISVKRSGH